jgi:hypothetical protein
LKEHCITHGILRSWSHEMVTARTVSIVLITPNTIVPTESLLLFADATWVPFVRDMLSEMKAIVAREGCFGIESMTSSWRSSCSLVLGYEPEIFWSHQGVFVTYCIRGVADPGPSARRWPCWQVIRWQMTSLPQQVDRHCGVARSNNHAYGHDYRCLYARSSHDMRRGPAYI